MSETARAPVFPLARVRVHLYCLFSFPHTMVLTHRLIILVVAVAILASATGTSLRFASYNIRSGSDIDDKYDISVTAAAIKAFVRSGTRMIG